MDYTCTFGIYSLKPNAAGTLQPLTGRSGRRLMYNVQFIICVMYFFSWNFFLVCLKKNKPFVIFLKVVW